jgi:hypothetical protein
VLCINVWLVGDRLFGAPSKSAPRARALLAPPKGRVGWWSTRRPGRFTPRKDPVTIVQEAGWASVLVWTSAENHSPTGIRSTDRPAHKESLHQLTYPDSTKSTYSNNSSIVIYRLLINSRNIWLEMKFEFKIMCHACQYIVCVRGGGLCINVHVRVIQKERYLNH